METSWGIPPPGVTVEKTSIKGTELSGSRTDLALGGGGSVDYAAVREAFRTAVGDAGWTFVFEAGKMPDGAPGARLSFGVGAGDPD